MSRRVSQSFTLSYAELKFIVSVFCETLPGRQAGLRFISEPLRENKNNFLVSSRMTETNMNHEGGQLTGKFFLNRH